MDLTIAEVHHPLCYHGDGVNKCRNKMATKEHCLSCQTCSFHPFQEVSTCNS